MRKKVEIIAVALFVQVVLSGAIWRAQAQAEKASYPVMASLDQYLIPDKDSEIALARSAAPKSISDGAEVMVLGRQGYTTAVKGTNGFLCLVERSWGAATDVPDFWNPTVRSPFALIRRPQGPLRQSINLSDEDQTGAGRKIEDGVQATASAVDKKELRPLEPGAMCYMLSNRQYLSDEAKSWHPHLTFFVPGDAARSWGANLPGSPVIAANDPEEAATIFMIWVATWSDGTPAPLQ